MKTLLITLFTSAFMLQLQAADYSCALEFEKTVVKSESMVPTWNPKLKKTMLMRIPFENFTSPFPDLVQFHIPIKGSCKDLQISSLKIFRQIGPQDWVKNNTPSNDDDHTAHQKPKKSLNWEKEAYKVFVPKLELLSTNAILRNVPIEDPLEKHLPDQHIWALKFEIEYKANKKTFTKKFSIEAPLIH